MDQGGLVLDSFLGSGTTGVTCTRLNRWFIGCDVDERQVQIATARPQEVNLHRAIEQEAYGREAENGRPRTFPEQGYPVLSTVNTDRPLPLRLPYLQAFLAVQPR